MPYILQIVVTLVLMGLLYWLFLWLMGQLGVPEPFNKVILVLVALCVFIYVAGVILGFASPLPIFGHLGWANGR